MNTPKLGNDANLYLFFLAAISYGVSMRKLPSDDELLEAFKEFKKSSGVQIL